MIIVLVLIAIVLIVAALRDTQGDLFAALKDDIADFGVWGSALIGLGLLGFVPGISPVSRALLMLVIVVLFVNNYQTIVDGFTKMASADNG